MSRVGRSAQELRAIFARLGRSKPVRRIAIGGAIAGGLYGLHRVRRAYKEHKAGTLQRALQKERDAYLKKRSDTLEFHRNIGMLPKGRKPTKKEQQRLAENARVRIISEINKKYPTIDDALKAQYPDIFKDPVTPKTSDSAAQEKVAEQKELEERAAHWIGADPIEKQYRVRRVPPRFERTQDVVSRMQGRRRRRYDY